MDIRTALKEQYRGGLRMLAECIEKCPDDLWAYQFSDETNERGWRCIRSFWRIAYHAAFYTHLYMGQGEEAFQPWPGRKPGENEGMWGAPWGTEPFEFPEDARVPSQKEILEYIDYIEGLVGNTVDHLDLETANSGFPWYKTTEKLSHELMNLRHIQGHVGQLSELLMQRSIDIDWIGKA